MVDDRAVRFQNRAPVQKSTSQRDAYLKALTDYGNTSRPVTPPPAAVMQSDQRNTGQKLVDGFNNWLRQSGMGNFLPDADEAAQTALELTMPFGAGQMTSDTRGSLSSRQAKADNPLPFFADGAMYLGGYGVGAGIGAVAKKLAPYAPLAKGVIQHPAQVAKGTSHLAGIGMPRNKAFIASAANPSGATAVKGLTADELIDIPGPIQAAYLRANMVHRSRNARLADPDTLLHPRDVPIDSGRATGDGTYLANNAQISKDRFSGFGDNRYSANLPVTEQIKRAQESKGYMTNDVAREMGIDFVGGTSSIRKGGSQTTGPNAHTRWDDEIVQDLRKQGYEGWRDDSATVDWNIGVPGQTGLEKRKAVTLETINDFLMRKTEVASDAIQRPISVVGDSLQEAFRKDEVLPPWFLDAFTKWTERRGSVLKPYRGPAILNKGRTNGGWGDAIFAGDGRPYRPNEKLTELFYNLSLPYKKVQGARMGMQSKYDDALKNYNNAERERIADALHIGSKLPRPPVMKWRETPTPPPGYVPGPAPSTPGLIDLLKALANQ